MIIPNLFVVGAMKSGTTTICSYLAEHPDIFICDPKEPMHFAAEVPWQKGNSEYLRLYEGAGNVRYLVDGSTNYTKRPIYDGVAKRIHDFNPDSKIVYFMRDPVERFVSEYRHVAASGREMDSPRAAIAKRSTYLVNSHYAYQIRPYLDLFGETQVFIETFETLRDRPLETCRRIFQWLGIDDEFTPPSVGAAFNAGVTEATVVDQTSWTWRTMEYLRGNPIAELLVPSRLRLWYRSTMIPNRTFRFNDDTFHSQIDEIRPLLVSIMKPWVREIEELTGRSFPEWATVSASVDSLSPASAWRDKVWLPSELSTA